MLNFRHVGVIPPAAPPTERGIRVGTVGLHGDGSQLRDLVTLAERGQLTPRVSETVPFDQAAHAHRLAAQRGLRGRVVLVSPGWRAATGPRPLVHAV